MDKFGTLCKEYKEAYAEFVLPDAEERGAVGRYSKAFDGIASFADTHFPTGGKFTGFPKVLRDAIDAKRTFNSARAESRDGAFSGDYLRRVLEDSFLKRDALLEAISNSERK